MLYVCYHTAGMSNKKTTTDEWFENYLTQESFGYEYEPYASNVQGSKNPDYLIKSKETKVLTECKEIEQLIFDKIKGVQSVDMQGHWDFLRAKIDEASEQLKPYAKKVDHTIIILGKNKGFASIGMNDLHYAMFGNPVIRVPIYTTKGAPRGKARFDLTVSGALRKNSPQTKQMYFPHSYISAVGIVQQFNAQRYYQSKFYDQLFVDFQKENAHKPLDEQLHEAFDLMEREWKKHEVPQEYADPDRMLYKVQVIINPLSIKPLPPDFFHGKYDEVRLPEVIET